MKICINEYGKQYTTVTLYLDPEDREVYTFCCIGSGEPEAAFNHRHISIGGLPGGFVPSTVENFLTLRIDDLNAIADAYEGTYWDGNNHVGRWTEEGIELSNSLSREIQDTKDIYVYADPADCFYDLEDDEKRAWAAQDHEERAQEMVQESLEQGDTYLEHSACLELLDRWEKEDA